MDRENPFDIVFSIRPIIQASWIWKLTAIAASVLQFTGCSSAKPSDPEQIVYWTGWSGHEYEIQKKLIEEFNRTHPNVRVRMLTQFSGTGSYQKVKIAFAGGATPDVMSTIWDSDLAGFAMRGVLTPLDGYLKRSGRDVDREFTPGIARMVRIDGRVYGLTVTTNASFIVFNKSAFREAGLNPGQPPRTPMEFDQAAKACTKYDANGNLVRYGFRPENLDVWAYVFGGDWYNARTHRITANDPHNVAALRWMAGYSRMFDLRKILAFHATFGDNDSANGPFLIGKVAMWHTGEWSEEFIRSYAPHLEWGWFPLPSPPDGRTNVTPARGSIFAIPAACKHKEAAWEFLNWITSVHAVKTFCAEIHNVPPLIEAGKAPAFQSDPLMRFATALCQGENSFGAPPIPIWATYKREIQRAEDRAVLGGEDPQRLLDELQVRMEKELSRTLDELRE